MSITFIIAIILGIYIVPYVAFKYFIGINYPIKHFIILLILVGIAFLVTAIFEYYEKELNYEKINEKIMEILKENDIKETSIDAVIEYFSINRPIKKSFLFLVFVFILGKLSSEINITRTIIDASEILNMPVQNVIILTISMILSYLIIFIVSYWIIKTMFFKEIISFRNMINKYKELGLYFIYSENKMMKAFRNDLITLKIHEKKAYQKRTKNFNSDKK